MKKKKWIILLAAAGVLVLSGTAWADASGTFPDSSQSMPGLNWAVNQIIPVSVQEDASQAPDNSISPSGVNDGPFEYGYGMMGGFGGYENGNNGGNNSDENNNGGNNGYGFGESGGSGNGMMGGYGGYGYGMMGGQFNDNNSGISVKDDKSVASDMTASLTKATVDKSNNTVAYTGNDITIVLLGGPENADGKFVIGGLVNPTLQVAKGANVTLELINEDEGMPHGVEITAVTPPYDYMSMMDGAIYPGTFILPIPEADNGQYAATQTSFTANEAGTFYYICQYPGHAQKGMYGKILIQ